MNARTPESALSIESFNPAMPLGWIVSSPTNPRKRFDQASMDELTANVKLHGVLTPVLVRPNPANELLFELVFGERRLRAAQAAGLETIPSTIRQLTDVQVIEIQIIENLQRADVHPIEEAEGYERLMAQAKPDGHHYTADDIAAKVGKSRRYVYNRLQLTKLCPEARNAFYDGKIDIKKAEAISRIGHHDTQRAALKEIAKPNYAGDTMSSRDVARLIARDYMTALKDAPFDIKIVDYQAKGKVIAGACGACPKRTGNAPDLFDEITTDKDTCTDIKCFHAKRDAQVAREAAEFEAKGLKVITGKEAKAILPSKWSNDASGEYVSHSQRNWDLPDSYGKLIGKAIAPAMVRNENSNEWVKVFPKAEVHALLKTKGVGKKADKPKAGAPHSQPMGAAGTNGYSQHDVIARGFRLVRDAFATGAQEADVRFLITCAVTDIFDYQGDLEIVGPIYAPELWNAGEDFDWHAVMEQCVATIEKLPNEALPQALLDLTAQACIDGGRDTAGLMELIKRHGQTEKKILKQLEADAKALAEAKAAAVKPTEPVLPVIQPLIKPQVEKAAGKKGKKAA